MKWKATPKHADTDPGAWLAQLHHDGPGPESEAFHENESLLSRPYVAPAHSQAPAHEPSDAHSWPFPVVSRRQAERRSGTWWEPVQAPRLPPPGEDGREPCPLFAAAPGLPDGHVSGRAVIGDRLRRPILWCQLGSCVAWHADPAAVGEADNRARAVAAGWREDALGRIACPACLQSSPEFRTTYPLVPWDSKRAVAMLTLWEAATRQRRDTSSDGAATGDGWVPGRRSLAG